MSWSWSSGVRKLGTLELVSFGATMCICFGLTYPLSATFSRRKFVLSEATVLLLSKGPVAKSLSEKQNSQGRTREVYVSTYTLQAYLRGYGIAKTLTIATCFCTPPLSALASTKKGCLRRVLTDVLVDFRSGRLLELTVWLSLVGVCGQHGLSTQPPVCLEQGWGQSGDFSCLKIRPQVERICWALWKSASPVSQVLVCFGVECW